MSCARSDTAPFAGALKIFAVLCLSAAAWGSVTGLAIPNRLPLSKLEKSLRAAPSHISEFAAVEENLTLAKCGRVRAPEPLLTPDPLLHLYDDDLEVRVSFIVGADGHVHSAFVLEGGGPDEDIIVLRTVRFWRFRPAFCNGVPTDSEALVRFTIR
jgi:TonB family protein